MYDEYMPQWFVYILRCSDNTLYTGISTDVAKRVVAHNTGAGAKYTRSRLPVVCVWQEMAMSESIARKREAAIKRLTRAEKQKLVRTYKHI